MMRETNTRPRRLRRAFAGTASLAAVAVLAAACSSSNGGTTAGGGSPGSGPMAATVKKLSAPLASYPVPADTLTGVSAVKGKTVYYVPITLQTKQFTITANALRKALATVGANLQVCNGNTSPSEISACVGQATAANAGAIVTDSIPYAMAANAFGAAQAKHIPVLITDQIADPAHPAGATLGYVEGEGKAMLVSIADWIIADSGGQASVVVNEATDSPSTIAYVAAAQAEFAKNCPACKVSINKISSANFSLIASQTSSALLQHPDAKYVVSEFDQYIQPTLGGIQQSGRAASVKLVSTAGGAGSFQSIAAKGQLWADVGQASTYQGWVTADAALRMMLGKPLPAYDIPTRLITRDNVGTIKLTDAAEASGEWFGPTDFPARFGALWS